MMLVKSFALTILTSLCVPYASAAIVSLYLLQDPGVPYTADPIDTDKSGHTTWRLGVGASSGTFTATEATDIGSVTLAEGATDFRQVGAIGTRTEYVDCARPTSTASGGVVVASCRAQLVDGLSTFAASDPRVTLTPIPVQVADSSISKSATATSMAAVPTKSNGAQGLRLNLNSVAVSALSILGTAGVVLVL